MYLMFRELVKMSKKFCFMVENSTFDAWVSKKSPKIYKMSLEQCANYTL